MSTNVNDDRVIIIGAGPVGLATALFLVNEGVPVTVLEQALTLPEDMRASTFHPASLDMLAQSGIAAALVAEGHKAERWQYFRTDTKDAAIFDMSVLSDVTAHPFRLQCEQFRLTKAIVVHLADHPLFEIRFNAAAKSCDETAQGVRVTASVDGRDEVFAGRYVVGADGAKSTVRGWLGLDLVGETYTRTSVTIVVDYPFEKHLGDMLYVNYVWTADDHYSLMRVRDHWRTGFSPKPGQSIEDAIAEPSLQAHINRILPSNTPYPIVHKGAYTIHKRIADTFRRGRIVLAGDAAHLNSPAGGMGMNSGIHDAAELAASLAQVLRGGDDAVLDRYSRRRHTIAIEDVQAQSDANYKRHREKDPAKREQIWADLKATCADRDKMRAFLMKSSMLASVARAAAIP
ncbi:MAG: FAD-dependent monooxygenase [Rhodospirillaceae bacterium]|nr:FAD-dependent monooxygenase [Rhodospirillaceae bacterium]